MQINENPSVTMNDGRLYAELFTPLFRYLFFRTSDHEVANDLTQAVFLKFLLQKDRPEEGEHARRLLFTIARTTLIDHWRVVGKRTHVLLEDIPEPQSEIKDPQAQAIEDEDKKFVRDALAQLTPLESEIVALRLADELDHASIAEVVGQSAASVRQIYSRSLKKVALTIQKTSYFN